MSHRLARWCAGLLVLPVAWPAAAVAQGAMSIDAEGSDAGFLLRTRWGQRLEGRFPVLSGEVRSLGGGRKQVRLDLSTRDVEIVGNPRYSRLTRGEAFFDAGRHPHVVFVSEPFDEGLVQAGGDLVGMLEIRGVQRREVFRIEPAACERPVLDCPVVAAGTVDRGDYAMDRWGFALGERVEFRLALRGREAGTP
ncbi:YceI family protein [Luteimonas sp. Y-2-2-4F]|nr:YceI family protein [Luteimonas sp. Y-2-2-4F]